MEKKGSILEDAIKVKRKNRLSELEELIELAEDISSQIKLNTKRAYYLFLYQLIGLFVFSFLAIYCLYFTQTHNTFYDNYGEMTILVFGIFLVCLAFFIIRLYFDRRRILDEVNNEGLMLSRLFDMIHSYKELIYSETSIVKKAILEMRLNRIKFSNDQIIT